MKTLDEIKEEVAKERGYQSFDEMMWFNDDLIREDTLDAIAKRYAAEVAKQALEDAAENAEVEYYDWDRARVDKESITETGIKLP